MITTATDAPKIVRELPPSFALKHGSHKSFLDGACLMEAVAYVAGEPHSDHPQCASPVLTDIAIRLNDRFSDDERQLLAPLIPRLVGTRTSRAIDVKRAYSMVDSAIREIVPLGLDAVKWADLAARLRELAPIVDVASAQAARTACDEVRAEGRKRSASASAYADAASAYADAASASAASASASAYADAAADADADAASASADAASASAYAAASASASADAASASAYADDADDDDVEERARLRSAARRPIIEASVRAFERAIAITA